MASNSKKTWVPHLLIEYWVSKLFLPRRLLFFPSPQKLVQHHYNSSCYSIVMLWQSLLESLLSRMMMIRCEWASWEGDEEYIITIHIQLSKTHLHIEQSRSGTVKKMKISTWTTQICIMLSSSVNRHVCFLYIIWHLNIMWMSGRRGIGNLFFDRKNWWWFNLFFHEKIYCQKNNTKYKHPLTHAPIFHSSAAWIRKSSGMGAVQIGGEKQESFDDVKRRCDVKVT